MKDNIQRNLSHVEEAWLYEEIGYIYEKAGTFDAAEEYYQEAQSKYEQAYTKEYLISTENHYAEGDWNKYCRFFVQQIPDLRLIHFHSDDYKANDCRRITYRILNLEELKTNL